MANKAKIRKLIARLRRIKPERYNQSRWCGTACCIAGHAARMEGWKNAGWAFVRKDGEKVSVEYVARRILGLDSWEAGNLFDGTAHGWAIENGDAVRSGTAEQRVQAAINELKRYL